MDKDKIQNLKIKVLEAKNLNLEEKSEWLVLLDLMNEHQMADLEEILKNLETKAKEEKQNPARQTLEPQKKLEDEKNFKNIKTSLPKKHHFILPKDGFFLPVPFPIPVPRPPHKNITELKETAQENLFKNLDAKALPLPKFTTISYAPIQNQKALANKPSEFFKSLKNILGKKELPKPKITSISFEAVRAEKALAQTQENAKHPNIFKRSLNNALAQKELPKPKITSISYEEVRLEQALANKQQKQKNKAVSGFLGNLKNILTRKELTKPSIDAVAKKETNILATQKEEILNIQSTHSPAAPQEKILDVQTLKTKGDTEIPKHTIDEDITIIHAQQVTPEKQNLEKKSQEKNESFTAIKQVDQKPSSFLKSLKNIIISADSKNIDQNSVLSKTENTPTKPTARTSENLNLIIKAPAQQEVPQNSQFITQISTPQQSNSALAAQTLVSEKSIPNGITLQAIIKPQIFKTPEKKSEVDIALDKVIAKQKAHAKIGDFSPGLKLEGVMLGERQDEILNLKEKIAEKNAKTLLTKKPQMGKRPLASIALDNIQDLGVLELRDLKTLQPEILLAKIIKLIMQNGYFSVIFQLEKSPLFTAYINTGLKLLAEKTDFDNIKFNNEEQTMSKTEFENFVDILRRLQGERVTQEEN